MIHQILTKDFMGIYKKCTAKKYSFLVSDTTLLTDDPMRFRKNLLDSLQNEFR